MKIQVICVGKTQQAELKSWLPDYCKRLTRFTSFDWHEIPDLKNTKNIPEKQQKTDEGKLILGAISPSDTLVIFDEKGSTYTSKGFFIGGPYGFSAQVYDRAQGKIALSYMTFSHQMVRIFVAEQLYRAFSILNNQPYHHE